MEEIHHLLAGEFFTPGNIPLKVIHRSPQPPYPLHTHDFMELVIVISGEGYHYSPLGEVPIKEGAVFVIKGDMVHGYKKLKNLCLINILFNINQLAIPLSDLGQSPGFHSIFTIEPNTRFSDINRLNFRMDQEKISELAKIVHRLENQLTRQIPGSQFLSVSIFMQIMHFISQEFDNQHREDSHTIPYRLGKAFSYMETHINENLSIPRLAEMAGMSESSLLRAFKKIAGISPTRYHQKLRVKRAAWYLKYSDYSIMEISDLMGYNDSNYFARQFRSIQGVSPTLYRKKSHPELLDKNLDKPENRLEDYPE